MIKNLYNILLSVLVLALPQIGHAQMPDCLNSGGFVYIHEGNTIKNWDPNQPPGPTNPALNTINCPGGGLAVSDYLGPGPTYKTFYTVVGNMYWYYDGTAWVSTGHTVGNGAAVNLGAGGGYIYNLVGFTGEVYRYDGTGNGTLLTTVAGFNGGGPYDLVADKDGNWYILNLMGVQYLRKYSPTGVLLKQWSIVGAPSSSAGGGMAIVCNEIYYHNGPLYHGVINDTSVVMNLVTGVAMSPGDFGSCELGTSAPSGGADTSFYVYRGCLSVDIDFRIKAEDSGATFNLQMSGNAQNGLDYAYIDSLVVIAPGDTFASINIAGLLRSPSVGNRNLTLEVIGENACLGGGLSVLRTINVEIRDSLEVAITTPPVTVCPGDLITINATKDPTLDHEWQPQSLLTDAHTLTVTANPSMTQRYSVKVTQPGAPATCPPRTVYYTAVVEPFPVIELPADRVYCLSDSVTIEANVSPTNINYNYSWTPTNGFGNPNVMKPKFFEQPGTYNKILTASSPVANCTSADSMLITVVPPFQITDIANDTVINYGDEITIFADGPYAKYWSWTPTTHLNNYNTRDVRAYPKETTTYKVIIHDEYGCFDEGEIVVQVLYQPQIFLPNAFTPNGDGLNDVFKFESVKAERLSTFQIYDRYGKMVFQTTDIHKGWDGTYMNGKEASPGVYYYFIEYFDISKQVIQLKGDVTLAR